MQAADLLAGFGGALHREILGKGRKKRGENIIAVRRSNRQTHALVRIEYECPIQSRDLPDRPPTTHFRR